MAEEQYPAWVAVQKKTFTRWANTYLVERNMPIQDIQVDLKDGLKLINLLECISTHVFQRYNKNPKILNQRLENISFALNFLKDEHLKLVGIGPEDIMNGNLKLILGLIWTIILRYQIEKGRKESAKNALLEWVRSKIPEYNVNNFSTSWADGLAICALANALLPDTVNMEGRTAANPLQNATDGVDGAEEKMGIAKVLAPEDMVAAADELSCMTYISLFRDWDEAHRKHANEEAERARLAALERNPDASKCSLSGLGLQTGEVNIPADFQVQARNAAGKPIPVGGDRVTFELKTPDGTLVTETSVKDNGNGTYDCQYIPRVDGKHSLVVNINEAPITKSPVTVIILPPQPDASKCTASGPGVTESPAGVPAVFTVQANNRIGEPIHVGGHPFKAEAKGPFGESIHCELKDNKDGTYSGIYDPLVGTDVVTITCAGKPIKDSPFHVAITADPNRAFAGNSIAFGPGVEGGCNTFDPCPFTIQAVSPSGEKIATGGDKFSVIVEDEEGKELEHPVEIKDNGDGTHSVVYHAPTPGMHIVRVGLHLPKAPLFFEPIKGSPYRVPIEPGLDPSKCVIAVPDSAEVNIPTELTVQANNVVGKPMANSNAPVKVAIKDAKGTPVDDVVVEPKSNGEYLCKFTPKTAGPHTVSATICDKPLKDSAELKVLPPTPDPAHCTASGPGVEGTDAGHPAVFTVQAKNKIGDPIAVGGHDFKAQVQGPAGPIPCDIVDNGDGTYTGKYDPLPGDNVVTITCAGKPIKDAPFHVAISADPNRAFAGKSFAFGPGVEGGCNTFDPCPFTIQAVTPEDKKMTQGGEHFTVEIEDPAGKHLPTPEVKDNGDGTYGVVYQVSVPGVHIVKVNLHNPKNDSVAEPIKDSPFRVDIAAGLDPHHCVCQGPGIEESGVVLDTEPTQFQVITKDCRGQEIKTGGLPVECVVTDEAGKSIPTTVTDNNDGTYNVEYSPDDNGKHVVQVTCKGAHLDKSPYTVMVGEGPIMDVQEYAFIIQAKTKKGGIHTGFFGLFGPKFEAEVRSVDGAYTNKAVVKDIGNGRVSVSFSAPQPGDYEVHVTLKGKPIKGSPFKQTVN